MRTFLPKLFFCAGCRLPSSKTICLNCNETFYWNSEILPSFSHSIEGVAPLLLSFQRTQTLIRRWKEKGGSDLRSAIFKMPPLLHQKLIENHFFAIIPIPQDSRRSFARGHESALEVAKFYSKKLNVPIISLLELKDLKTERITGKDRFHREYSENPFRISKRFPEQHWMAEMFEEKILQGKEIRILLVDDLITTGSTVTKASETLLEFIPRSKIWVGSIGLRPGDLGQMKAPRLHLNQARSHPVPLHLQQ